MAATTTKANDVQVGGEHYRSAKYQHWDFAADNRMGYFEGQITKYVTRWRKKNGVQDLEKALHFADKLYELLTSGSFPAPGPRAIVSFTEFAQSNTLGSVEAEIVAMCARYTEAFQINRVRDLIRKLIQSDKEKNELFSS